MIVFRFRFMTFYGKRMNIYMKICTYIYLQNSIIYLSRMRASTLFSAQVLFKNVARKREKKTFGRDKTEVKLSVFSRQAMDEYIADFLSR